jgi:hypothetical protein
MAARQGISRIDISLSHDGGIAMAVAAAIPSEAASDAAVDTSPQLSLTTGGAS